METLKASESISNQLEDSQVVKRVLSGEKELFEILVRRNNQTLYRVIRSYLKDSEDVQDAMQNTYLKAFHKLMQFHGDSSFSTWLIRIGINEALLRLKEMKKGRVVSMNSINPLTDQVYKIPDKRMNPENAVLRQEAKRLVEQAIDSLPEKYRVVYMLKEIEGLDNAQIQAVLDLTESNIKVRLHRAKNLLRDSLYELSSSEVFEFGNNRCDAIVAFVMSRI